ncbi:MAG: hemerythrin domain-containing protein [Polyangiales bacterium]
MLLHPLRGPSADVLDPVGFFLACHVRIRNFTELACRIADARDVPPAELMEAARTVQWFFAMALPLHAEDEDVSLAPRLLEARVSPEVEHAIALQAAQHPIIESIGADIAEMARAVAQAPDTLSSVRRPLGNLAASLGTVWEVHLGLEERTLFPAMRELPRATNERILAECQARRKTLDGPPVQLRSA